MHDQCFGKHHLENIHRLIIEEHVKESIISPRILFNQAIKLSLKTKDEVTTEAETAAHSRVSP